MNICVKMGLGTIMTVVICVLEKRITVTSDVANKFAAPLCHHREYIVLWESLGVHCNNTSRSSAFTLVGLLVNH